MPYSTRRATIQVTPYPIHNVKENTTPQSPSPLNVCQPSPAGQDQHLKKRHRMSSTQLTRLESVFRKDTHPSKQEKQELADELGLNYRTITIWLQNKRQSVKRYARSLSSLPSRHQEDISLNPDKQDPPESPSALSGQSSSSTDNALKPVSLHHDRPEANLRTTPTPSVHDPSPKKPREIEPLLSSLGPPIAAKPPLSKDSYGNFDQAQSPAASTISADCDEPCRHLSLSPPAPSPSSAGESETYEAVRSGNGAPYGKRCMMLERARDMQAKRRRRADQFSDITEGLDRFWVEPSSQSIPPALLTHSSDVIHAASLLLNFKYSLRGRKAGEWM